MPHVKENREWIYSWCEDTVKEDKPRVLLIGDSITHNYQEIVRKKLRDVCYVDYVATAYAIDTDIYNALVKNFVMDSKYALIHFNNGLHGIHLSKRSYKSRVQKLIDKFPKDAKLILALSTCVYLEGNKKWDRAWMKRVKERNEAMKEIAEEKGLLLDDLFQRSLEIPKEKRYVDGTHYEIPGYEMLADTVANCIRENL